MGFHRARIIRGPRSIGIGGFKTKSFSPLNSRRAPTRRVQLFVRSDFTSKPSNAGLLARLNKQPQSSLYCSTLRSQPATPHRLLHQAVFDIDVDALLFFVMCLVSGSKFCQVSRRIQRFANVAIFPKPNSRWSAVTRVRLSTSAVAAKKRSAGS